MGICVNRYMINERSDLGYPQRVVARGVLDQAAAAGLGAWIGEHPGFIDAITHTGNGDQTVVLAADGAATMYVRTRILRDASLIAHAAVLGGAGLRDARILVESDAGAATDGAVFIEVLQT